MTGPGTWPRPPSSVPPWLAAILTVAGVVLMISALPMLASAITPDRGGPVPAAGAPPSPVPLPDLRAAIPPTPLPLERRSALGQSPGDRDARSAGARSADARSADARSADAGSADAGSADVRGLPRSGGNPVPPLLVALVLLSAGLGLLHVVGCSGDRPWPGRYVRRIG